MRRSLRLPLTTISIRKGRKFESVPVPYRRNKQDVSVLQTLAKAVKKQPHRTANMRIKAMLENYTVQEKALKSVTEVSAKIYEDRTNLELRPN